jgi:hypothetical protein
MQLSSDLHLGIDPSAKSPRPDVAANILETAVLAGKCPTQH